MTPKLDMIGLTVDDIERSVAFYRLLGVEVEPEPGRPYAEATLAGGVRLSWNTTEMMREIHGEHWVEPRGQRIGLAWHCGDAAGVDTVHAELVEAGYASEKAPWDAFWGQRYAIVKDPDGNGVELFAPLAG